VGDIATEAAETTKMTMTTTTPTTVVGYISVFLFTRGYSRTQSISLVALASYWSGVSHK
jgi:hypothetical protein